MYVCILYYYAHLHTLMVRVLLLTYVYTEPSQLKELTVHKDKITETTITVSWKEPNPSDVPIIGYEVQYRKSGEEFKKVEKV